MLMYLRDGSALMIFHAEIEIADQTFDLTQSQYTDTRPTSPSADLMTPGTWQGSHWSAIFKPLVWLDLEKCPMMQVGIKPWICYSRDGCLSHLAKAVTVADSGTVDIGFIYSDTVVSFMVLCSSTTKTGLKAFSVYVSFAMQQL